jgi:hypothetical protein
VGRGQVPRGSLNQGIEDITGLLLDHSAIAFDAIGSSRKSVEPGSLQNSLTERRRWQVMMLQNVVQDQRRGSEGLSIFLFDVNFRHTENIAIIRFLIAAKCGRETVRPLTAVRGAITS